MKLNIKTSCLTESKYLLERALRTRGLAPHIVNQRTFEIESNLGHFSLSFMPGNRRVLISHDVFVNPNLRHQGIGKRFLELREKIVKEAGINLLLATVKNANKVEIHLLKSHGWRKLIDRQETDTSLWSKKL